MARFAEKKIKKETEFLSFLQRLSTGILLSMPGEEKPCDW
jgi:hypothetical protein